VKAAFTLSNLVDAALQQLASLPPPPNGQVRQIPDERTIRFYASIGLLDRPAAHRGRTALYNKRHLAQVVAIKRLQQVGKSLADIQALWSTIDDRTLMRISGMDVPDAIAIPRAVRDVFWKRPPAIVRDELPPLPPRAPATPPEELRIELAPGVTLVLTGAAKQRLLSALQPTKEEP
jgi:hypothetical protein